MAQVFVEPPHVAPVRHLNDKKTPDHWRAV
jgi:hypothetical protein